MAEETFKCISINSADPYTRGIQYGEQAKELIAKGFKAIKIPAHRLLLKEGRGMLNSEEMMEMFHYMEDEDLSLIHI